MVPAQNKLVKPIFFFLRILNIQYKKTYHQSENSEIFIGLFGAPLRLVPLAGANLANRTLQLCTL